MKMLNKKLILTLTITLFFTACMPESLTKYKQDPPPKGEPSNPSTPSDPGTGSSETPPNLTILKSFQLKNITQNSTTYHLHKYGVGNASSACEIPSSTLADGSTQLTDQSNDILCWLEADEVQLFFNGASFQLNAPPGQCDYIRVSPYYFWTHPPANSKKVVKTVECDDSSNGLCIGLGGVTEADTKCVGDYTSTDGPNCDEGFVTINAYAVLQGKQSFAKITKACDGKRVNCYGGPGVDLSVSKKGFPIPMNYLAFNGESVNYSITAPGPLGKGYFSNHYISNFTQTFSTGLNTYDYTKTSSNTGMELFGRTSSTSSPTYSNIGDASFDNSAGLTASSIAAVDYGLDPLKRADATLRKNGEKTWETLASPITYTTQPFYEFSCLNYAHEVKGRIRVQIREWNQEFAIPITSEVAESAPQKLLRQSANATDYEISGVGYWNDIPNWDSPIEFGPSVGLVPLMPTAIGDKGFAFPYLDLVIK